MKYLLRQILLATTFTVMVIAIANAVRDSNIPEKKYAGISWGEYSYQPDYDRSRWNILFDQHSHTIYSDGVLTPEQNIQWHIAMGFNAMVISDHNSFAGIDEAVAVVNERYSDKIVLIPGLEWTTDRLHMNFLFPPGLSQKTLSNGIQMPGSHPSDREIEAAIEAAHALGAIVTVNHIIWTDQTYPDVQPSREQFLQWGVDYIEIINEATWDHESYDFIQGNRIGAISGTDMHRPGSVHGWTVMNAAEFSAEAVFDQLRSGDTELVYLPVGAPYPFIHEGQANPLHTALKPLIALGDYFTSLTWPVIKAGELIILLCWVYIVTFAIALIRLLFRRLTAIFRN